MKERLGYATNRAVALAAVGLVAGAVAGWAGILLGDGLEDVASTAVSAFRALFVLLPLGVLWQSFGSLRSSSHPPVYSTLSGSLLVFLVSGLVGGLGACLLYIAAVVQIAAIFGGINNLELHSTLLARIGWDGIASVVAATTLTALALALWAHYQSK